MNTQQLLVTEVYSMLEMLVKLKEIQKLVIFQVKLANHGF